jgi:hypothetical protein
VLVMFTSARAQLSSPKSHMTGLFSPISS